MKKPRDFQLRQVECVRAAFKRGVKGVVVASPTGSGKGYSIAEISRMVKDKGGRVLILVNRDILVSQLIAELKGIGVFAAREQAMDRASLTADVVVASIQSLIGDRLKRFPQDHFRLIILDEMHSSGAKTIKIVLDYFHAGYHCGFTATPTRHDKAPLWKGYQEIVFNYTIAECINDGWLVPFEFVDLDCPVVYEEKLAKCANIGENQEVFDSNKYLPRLADCALEECRDLKSLFFLPNCRVSKMFAEHLRARGGNAEHIDSSYMPESETTRLLKWFSEDPTATLTNASLLTTGFDQRDIRVVGMFRPVVSIPLTFQMWGRGTRPIVCVDDYDTPEERKAAIAASDKSKCKIITPFWENEKHDLATPWILVTEDEDEIREMKIHRKAGTRVDMAQMESKLKAAKVMKDQEEQMRRYAEQVANSQEKKQRGALYIADILKNRNPSHKLASDKFVRYVSRAFKVNIPPGEYSAYQIMRIKERCEKHQQKAA